MKSDSELICKDMLDRFIKYNLNEKEVAWIDVELENEPPDFYLDYCGISYAVEVTEFPLLEKVGDRFLPERTVSDNLFKLIKEIEVELKDAKKLNNKYYVCFCGGYVNFNKTRKQIKEGIVNFICRGDSLIDSNYTEIFRQGDSYCKIKKDSHVGSKITGFFQQSHSTLNINNKCNSILLDVINIKKKKLSNIHNRKILLIWNSYILGLPDNYMECLKNIPEASFFDKIFIVEGDKAFLVFDLSNDWS